MDCRLHRTKVYLSLEVPDVYVCGQKEFSGFRAVGTCVEEERKNPMTGGRRNNPPERLELLPTSPPCFAPETASSSKGERERRVRGLVPTGRVWSCLSVRSLRTRSE